MLTRTIVLLSIGTMAFAQLGDLATSLQSHKEKLVYNDIIKLSDRISSASVPELRQALPAVIGLSASKDPVEVYNATFAILCVASRPDGLVLLESGLSQIVHLVQSPDPTVSRYALQIILLLKEVPTDIVIPPIVRFLRIERLDGHANPAQEELQAMSISILIQYAPADKSALEAIRDFLARPLLPSTRVIALAGVASLRSPGSAMPEIIVLLLPGLDDPDWTVREAAIQAIGRMGPAAASLSSTRLSAIAADVQEIPSLRAAAKEAFDRVQGVPPHLSRELIQKEPRP